jgi:hypothetical protein
MEENLALDLEDIQENKKVVKKSSRATETTTEVKREKAAEPAEFISCLRNEKVLVKHIPRESGMVSNPKHVFYGGMAENSVRIFTVPILESSGSFMNVLTNDEKNFLEEIMGLEYNALSIYKKQNNFWANYTVRLTKGENYLDLSNPDDYIKYKVLLANKDFIAASLRDLQDRPKATYQFVLIMEEEETKHASMKMSATMEAYLEFGKLQEETDTLRLVLETLDGRPTSPKSKLDFLQTQVNKLIQSNPQLFLKTVKDPFLPTKVLIRRSIEAGLLAKRGDYLYLKSDNSPLCESGEDPTLNVAAKYLNSPKHQEVKLMLEAKLK